MTMHSKTSSVGSCTVNSSATDGEAAGNTNAVNMAVYACLLCPRTFPSRRALGGHQNAHRIRPAKPSNSLANRKPPVVRPPISTGTVRALRMSATPMGRYGFTDGPAARVQPGRGRHGHGSMTVLGGGPLRLGPTGPRGDGLPKPSMEAPGNYNNNHPYPKPVPAPQRETDLRRVWMPTTWVGEGAGSGNSSEPTAPKPDVRASKGDEDGV